MVSNDDFDGKATHLNCFYLHINFEQKYPKPAIMARAAVTKAMKYIALAGTRGISIPTTISLT